MKQEIRLKILQQVQKSIRSLVGGSGHLASYEILPDTFEIINAEKVQSDLNKYTFVAEGYRESEFTIYDDTNPPKSEHICGNIILDKDFEPIRDKEGKIILYPYDCAGY